MKAQIPAVGIALVHKFGTSSNYHIECDCGDVNHSVKMWIEVNKETDFDHVTVSFYVKAWTPFWETSFSRIKTAWHVLTKGYHQQEHHLLLNAQSACNLANILNIKIKELEKK